MKNRLLRACTSSSGFLRILAGAVLPLSVQGLIVVDEALVQSGYTQSFNTLPTAGGFTWANNSTLPGWYAARAGGSVNTSAVTADGSGNLADQIIANLGLAGQADRALAFHTRLQSSPTYLAAGLVNDTEDTLQTVQIGYTGEQWRESSDQRTLTLSVDYRVGDSAADLASTTGWTELGELLFSSLNGFAGRSEILLSDLLEVEWGPGETLWIRWTTQNSATSSTASNDIVAIDDVMVSFGGDAPDILPAFTRHPVAQSVGTDEVAIFSARATGRPEPTYQWYLNGHILPGSTDPFYLILNAQPGQAGTYTVVAQNAAGDVESSPALLQVSAGPVAPTIVTPPASLTVAPGGFASLSVKAAGSPPLAYQWQKAGGDLPGETNSTLLIAGATPDEAGLYRVRVTNGAGAVYSAEATVTVANPPDFGLVGWATAGSGTTGGAGGGTAVVSDYAAFAAAAFSDLPLIIEVVDTITGIGEAIRVKSNKTILGRGADARLENLGLNIGWNSSFGEIGNVIIRNITFGSVRAPTDKVSIAYGAKNVWIDHCVFISDLAVSGTNKDYYDGQLDITRGAEFVTVSWCRFVDHYKNSLVGHGEGNASQDTGKLTVTYHHNAFINVNSRNPSVRFGRVHVFNNYFLNVGDYAIASRLDAEVIVENNWFENVRKPIGADTSLSSVPGFVRGVKSNVFLNCGDNNILTAPATWMPATDYAYTLDPVANVPDLVMQWSGVGVLDQSGPPLPPPGFAEWIATTDLPDDERGPGDDPDGDGIANLLEFVLGKNPAQPDKAPGRVIAWPSGDSAYLAYLYPRRKNRGNAELTVEVATLPSFPSDLGTVELATVDRDASFEYVVVRSAQPLSTFPAQFLRLRAMQP